MRSLWDYDCLMKLKPHWETMYDLNHHTFRIAYFKASRPFDQSSDGTKMYKTVKLYDYSQIWEYPGNYHVKYGRNTSATQVFELLQDALNFIEDYLSESPILA